MTAAVYESRLAELRKNPRRWLVTGTAGFISSHLTDALLSLGQQVKGLDNFATGKRENLQFLEKKHGKIWKNFQFIEGDIRSQETCRAATEEVEIVLHQAALGSVPRSINDPLTSHAVNVDGFIHMLLAARDAGIQRFVYASSSSIYGDSQELPKVEERIGKPLSPYAATKAINEVYAEAFARSYKMQLIGLRYFNVFGPRQDPEGPYAAVIPRWLQALRESNPVKIYGDGLTSRDFCYIDNVVQANILAGTTNVENLQHRAYNIACGDQLTLKDLAQALKAGAPNSASEITHEDFRPGDVRHSKADITKAQTELGYHPVVKASEGIKTLVTEYLALK